MLRRARCGRLETSELRDNAKRIDGNEEYAREYSGANRNATGFYSQPKLKENWSVNTSKRLHNF